jgi:hypothetical protein
MLRAVCGLPPLLRAHDERPGDGAQDAEGRDHQRKDDVVEGALDVAEAGREGESQDHASDDGAHVGLEQIGTHSADVTHVVAHEVGDHRRVAGIVLGDPRLDLADEVGSHVRRLRVDASADTGEEGDGRCSEAEPGEHLQNLVLHDVVLGAEEVGIGDEEGGEPEDAQADDGHAHHRAAREGDVQRGGQRVSRGGRGPDVGPGGHAHPEDSREARARRAHQERDRDEMRAVLVVRDEQQHRNGGGEDGKYGVLPFEERNGALSNVG